VHGDPDEVGEGLPWIGGASGEPGPNTLGTSGPMFSSTVFAVPTAPQLQPARVNGTQGAGSLRPSAPIML
jgi:hypothetical protein